MSEFSESQINEEEENFESPHKASYKNMIVGQEIIDLKTNHIPRGLVPLERLFDNNDVYLKSNGKMETKNTVDSNIGIAIDPKQVKISKLLPAETRKRYQEFISQYSDVFAWSYSDLKTYDKNVMQRKIPLKPDTKLMRQKLRHLNPMLFPITEKEIKKLWEAKIILPLRFSNWVANIVHVHKKKGEIRICVDFRNLNRCFLKDNYLLSKMDHILHREVGSKHLSMIDGFSSYNQIVVHKEDQEKTTFTTPWGMFMYGKMPFGLINVGATFQRAMDIAFVGERDKFVVIYLDDITVFSKSDEDHLKHLK